MRFLLQSLTLVCILVGGAATAQQTSNLTYGLVQQVVVKGASKEKVVEALGSPNMITSTSDKTETWIYDKISTTVEAQQNSNSASVGGGVVGGAAGLFGGLSKGESTNKATTSQKTMTVVIKFKGEFVETFSARVTSF